MPGNKELFKSETELQQAILKEKAQGTSDVEIGEKFGVSYKYIEKVITRAKGINVSNLNVKKRVRYLEPKTLSLKALQFGAFARGVIGPRIAASIAAIFLPIFRET
jgi:hypothetical protein